MTALSIASLDPATCSLDQLVYDTGDMCRVLGISLPSLARLRAACKLPRAFKLGGKLVWRAAEVREWVAAGMPPLAEWEAMRTGSQEVKPCR
jgi:predicted DNA-binding transcriptional regulator AlpA